LRKPKEQTEDLVAVEVNLRCPDCGSTALAVDPQDTFCKACSYRGPTSTFVEPGPPPVPMSIEEWSDENALELSLDVKRHVSQYVSENSEIESLTRLVMISVRRWTEEF
jgi:hypothetical protein